MRAHLKSSSHQKAYAAFRLRLRAAREHAGLTQADVATAMDRRQSFVSKCESGERRVDYVELQEFAKLYGVPLNFFDRT